MANEQTPARDATDALRKQDIIPVSGESVSDIMPAEMAFALIQWRWLRSQRASLERRIEEYRERYDFKD